MFDDELPRRKESSLTPRALDNLSIQELKDYISDLENEIQRAAAEIDKKQKHKDAIEGLFKT